MQDRQRCRQSVLSMMNSPPFFNGNERTVAIDLITDGILEAPRERCVRKRIFAPLGCNTLHLIIGCNERKISVPAPAYKGGSRTDEARAVLTVGHDRINAAHRQILKYMEVRERVVEPAAEPSDDNDIVRTAADSRLDSKLRVCVVLFGGDLYFFNTFGQRALWH